MDPGNEDVSPSFRIWTPPTYSPLSKNSPDQSAGALPYQHAGPFETPPRPPAVCPTFTPMSSCSTVATAFCVTPPLSSGRTPRPAFDPRTAVLNIPCPSRAPPPPPPPHGLSPSPSVGDKLVSFDSFDSMRPTEGNIVRNLAKLINSSLFNDNGDPFLSREKPALRPPMPPPLRLSPIKFPAEFEDPRKQIKLLPSPLQIQKGSGDVLKCGGPGVVIRKGSVEEQDRESDIKRPVRSRPPRLQLKIIPSNNKATNAGNIKSPILVSQSKSLSPLASPSPGVQLSTPCPVLQETTHILGSPFETPPHPQGLNWSNGSNSMSTYSPLPSPDEAVSAARAEKLAKFNQAVKWLREHIPEDLTDLRKQIEHVTDVQKARNSRNTTMSRTVSFWTFSPVKPKPGIEADDDPLVDGPNIDQYGNVFRTETKAQRITRLRKEGWRTGIRSKNSIWKGSEHYDKLCDTVLAELGESRGLTVEGHANLRK